MFILRMQQGFQIFVKVENQSQDGGLHGLLDFPVVKSRWSFR